MRSFLSCWTEASSSVTCSFQEKHTCSPSCLRFFTVNIKFCVKKSHDEDEYSLVHWLNKINLRHELQTCLPCLIKNKDAGVETDLYSLSLT